MNQVVLKSPPCKLRANKKYYNSNKETRKNQKEYYEKNKEAIKAKRKAYYQKKKAEYALNNPPKVGKPRTKKKKPE